MIRGDARPGSVLDLASLTEPYPQVIRRAVAPSRTRLEYRRLYRLMAGTDAAAVVVAVLLARLVSAQGTWGGLLPLAVLGPLVGIAVLGGLRLYAAHQLAPAEEFRRLLLGSTTTVTVLVVVSVWSTSTISRMWIAATWGLLTILLLLSRRLWHWHLWRKRQTGHYTFRTLIVGANEEASRVAELMSSSDLGYLPVGMVASHGASSGNGHNGARNGETHDPPVPVLGTIENLKQLSEDLSVDCLFVASSDVRATQMSYLSELARVDALELRVTANLPEVLSSRLSVQPLGGVMALSLRPASLSGPQALLKRVFDICLASVGLAFSLPVWLVIAAAIKLTSRGPVFFRQERVGRGGKTFTLLKFRTMVAHAEALLPELRAVNEADGPLFKLRRDPRVTRVGRKLRAWSLDELPQLINVLRGEMSLVGPRPPLPEEVRQYERRHFGRLEVPPGITGLWQVRGRSDASFEEYVRLDIFYVENWSLAYDMYILLKTVRAVFSREGAY